LQGTKKLNVDVGLTALSSSFARGNENNRHQADGVYYLGPGRAGGYSVINLGARYQVHPHAQFFVQINNLLDHRYYTAAQLGPTGFTAQRTFIARPFPAAGGQYPLVNSTFFAPGAPIGAWAGLRIGF